MTEKKDQKRSDSDEYVPRPCQEQTELEELFQTRYTTEDVDYMQTVNTPLAAPPCVENWYSKPKRSFDWSRDNQHHRGRGHHGNWRGHNRGQGHRDRSDDRHGRDHGNHGYDKRSRGYGQSHQGYNDRHDNSSYNDRSHDRHGYRDHHSHDRHGDRDHHTGEGRVNYAGMKQSDGSHQRRQHPGSHPYSRDSHKHWT